MRPLHRPLHREQSKQDGPAPSTETNIAARISPECSPQPSSTPGASGDQTDPSESQTSKQSPSGETLYDTRMPPPPVNWQTQPKPRTRPIDPTRSGLKTGDDLETMLLHSLQVERNRQRREIDRDVENMVEMAQKSEAPVAKGSWITGRRDQLDFGGVEAEDDSDSDEEEMELLRSYIRKGDDQGSLPKGWSEVSEQPATDLKQSSAAPTDVRQKRTRDEPTDEAPLKKRKLKSEFRPSTQTTWKPSWLDTTQCYPVDQFGQDMSDVSALWGDEIHRNTERMRRILERECMYVTTSSVDEFVEISRDMVRLCKTSEQFLARCPSKVRSERHKYTESEAPGE
jgi:hypothetical protein